jgi:hypothetical protein
MANITINKKLNLVLPVEDEKIWFYSTPISKEVFEANYLLLVKTLSNLYFNGIGPGMAPRIAGYTLRDMAKEMNDKIDISQSFVNEIYRLTFVFMIDPATNKWKTFPYLEVKNKKMVDEDVLTEVENALIYFTVASAIHLKSELPIIMSGLSQIWGAQTTSLDPMAYCNSLTMPTQEEITGEILPPIQNIQPQKGAVLKASSIPF